MKTKNRPSFGDKITLKDDETNEWFTVQDTWSWGVVIVDSNNYEHKLLWEEIGKVKRKKKK